MEVKTALPCATRLKQVEQKYYYSAVRQRINVIRDLNNENKPHTIMQNV